MQIVKLGRSAERKCSLRVLSSRKYKSASLHFQLTWPDIAYAASINRVCEYAEKELKLDYPELKKLVAKVDAIPSIKAYLAKRPKTEY